MIEKSLLSKYDGAKGRFRDWLKQCVKNFLMDEFRRRIAMRRGVGIEHVSIDDVDEDGRKLRELVDHSERQGSAFDRAWAQQVVRLSIETLGRALIADRKEVLFEAIKPGLSGTGTGTYAEIAQRLGMTEGALKTTISRLRDRLGVLIREEVRESVGSKAEVNDELRYLMDLLKKPSE